MRPLLLLTVVLTLSSCFGRKIPEGATLRISAAPQPELVIADGAKYWNGTERECLEKTLAVLRTELAGFQVTVVDSGKADYVLQLSSYTITESIRSETVRDTASSYNGQTFQLASCDISVNGLLISERNGRSKKVFAGASKDEQLKNNRTVFDLALGTNKDRTEYRQKTLAGSIYERLCEQSGQRLAAAVTRKMEKLKK